MISYNTRNLNDAQKEKEVCLDLLKLADKLVDKDKKDDSD